MKATGEVMAIDRTFEGALQKVMRGLELRADALQTPSLAEDGSRDGGSEYPANDVRLWNLLDKLRTDSAVGMVEELHTQTGIDRWFLSKLRNIVVMEQRLATRPLTPELLRTAKRMGFSDAQIARLTPIDGAATPPTAEHVRALRRQWGILPTYKMVDTCAAEFAAQTPYFYATYEQENEAEPLAGEKAVVLGSGPIRIGQGIEFDYCSVRSAQALREA